MNYHETRQSTNDTMTNATTLNIHFMANEGPHAGPAQLRQLVIAGWTGRDREAMEQHGLEIDQPRLDPAWIEAVKGIKV